jgi:hypothetical protein
MAFLPLGPNYNWPLYLKKGIVHYLKIIEACRLWMFFANSFRYAWVIAYSSFHVISNCGRDLNVDFELASAWKTTACCYKWLSIGLVNWNGLFTCYLSICSEHTTLLTEKSYGVFSWSLYTCHLIWYLYLNWCIATCGLHWLKTCINNTRTLLSNLDSSRDAR